MYQGPICYEVPANQHAFLGFRALLEREIESCRIPHVAESRHDHGMSKGSHVHISPAAESRHEHDMSEKPHVHEGSCVATCQDMQFFSLNGSELNSPDVSSRAKSTARHLRSCPMLRGLLICLSLLSSGHAVDHAAGSTRASGST